MRKKKQKEIQVDLSMAMSLRESLMNKNEDLTKELADANEILARFNKSATVRDEQIQSQR